MRQYTRIDCDTSAQEGQKLKITYLSKPICGGGECELIVGFKDPITNKIIYIPYKSEIEIAGRKYKVLEGKQFESRSGHAPSPKCLLDEKNNSLRYMQQFEHEGIKILDIHRSLPVRLARLLFNKSKPVNSIERLAA